MLQKLIRKKILLLVWVFLGLASSIFSSAQTVTLSGKDMPLKKVFTEFKKQTGYFVFYNEGMLDNTKPVSFSVRNISIVEFLDMVLKEQKLEYKIVDKTIMISRKEAAVKKVEDDNERVSGVVKDEKGTLLEGISVVVKGTSRGVVTNSSGDFSFEGVDGGAVLVFSGVGFESYEVRVGGRREIMVAMKTKVREMEEVMVSTGYQEVDKTRATGSFVQIDNELYNRKVGLSVLDRIIDLTPGLQYSPKGTKNPLDNFIIRGISTINSAKTPLLVVDNFIYEGDISSINPNDIESVTILKDAAAASIWGVRAGNGVIVLTTKKGKSGQKPTVTIRSDFTIGGKPNLKRIQSIPSKDIIDLERIRVRNGLYDVYEDSYPQFGYFPPLPEAVEILLAEKSGKLSKEDAEKELSLLEKHDIRNDINKYLIQNSTVQQYAISMTGGTTNNQYYTSFGFNRSRPIDINISNEQFTLRVNNKWRPIDKIDIFGEINWAASNSSTKNILGGYGVVLNAPYHRLADEFGNSLPIPKDQRLSYLDTVNGKGMVDWYYRPIDEAKAGDAKMKSNDVRLNGRINYSIINGLNVSASYQFQKQYIQETSIASPQTYQVRNIVNKFVTIDQNTGEVIYPFPLASTYSESNTTQSSWNFRAQADYSTKWSRHLLSALIGIETREVKLDRTQAPTQFGYDPKTNLFQPVKYGEWQSRPDGAIVTIAPDISTIRERLDRFGSYFANAGYVYDEKYGLSTSLRVDRSNFFGVQSNDQISPLWHIGASWDIFKEKFYNLSWLPYLKVRVTYGYNGNTNPSISPFATGGYNQPAAPVFLPSAFIRTSPNPSLRWEKVENINIGIDFELKGKRVSGTIETYNKNGVDLISSIAVNPTSGFLFYTGNNASIKGRGVDIVVNTKNFVSEFKWNTTFIFGYNVEEVTSYLISPFVPGTALSSPIVIGRPLSYLSSLRWAGLDSTNGDALFYMNKAAVSSVNINNITADDIEYSGRMKPSIWGAVRNDFAWKGITLSIGLTYKLGYVFRRSSFYGSITPDDSWQHADYLKSWKKPGDEKFTNVPGFLDVYSDSRYSVYNSSNILIEKGDHIRVQDIRLEYAFRDRIFKNLPIKNINIYCYMNNVGILWRANNKKIDPDYPSFYSIPDPRTISIGMQMGF